MPRGRRSNLRRRKPARRPRRKLRMPKMADKGQTCRVIETFEAVDLNSNQPIQHTFNLAQFPRACNIAPNFRFYRAAKVIYTYDPLYNTFQDGVNAASKPYMYSVMNRAQQLNQGGMNSVQSFQVAGARPVSFTSQKKISYKPNWCSPGLLQVRQLNTPPTSPLDIVYSSNGLQAQYGWLATPTGPQTTWQANQTATNNGDYPQTVQNPPPGTVNLNNSFVYNNTVVYNGHYTFIDQKFTGGETPVDPVARLTITVIWEFKGAASPLGGLGPAQTPPPAVETPA